MPLSIVSCSRIPPSNAIGTPWTVWEICTSHNDRTYGKRTRRLGIGTEAEDGGTGIQRNRKFRSTTVHRYRTSNGSTLTYLGGSSNSRYALRGAEKETLVGRARRHQDLAYDGRLQNAQKTQRRNKPQWQPQQQP